MFESFECSEQRANQTHSVSLKPPGTKTHPQNESWIEKKASGSGAKCHFGYPLASVRMGGKQLGREWQTNRTRGGHWLRPYWQMMRGGQGKVRLRTDTGCPCRCTLFHGALLFLSYACRQPCNNSFCSRWHAESEPTHHLNCNGDGSTTANKQAWIMKYILNMKETGGLLSLQCHSRRWWGGKVGYCMLPPVFYH